MGSKIKHEVKAGAYSTVGQKVEVLIAEAKAESSRYQGASEALVSAKKGVESVLSVVDQDAKEGTISIEESAKVKRWLVRAVGSVENLQIQSEAAKFQANGKIQALEKVLTDVKKLYVLEQAQLKGLLESEVAVAQPKVEPETRVSVRPVTRVPGTRPENSIANRKKPRSPKKSVPVKGTTRKRQRKNA